MLTFIRTFGRFRVLTPFVFCTLTLAVAPLSYADQPSETLPGFRAENVFETHGIDNVNLFSGDPGIVIPLGPEYVLGSFYRWQLKAYYSAKFWTMATCDSDAGRAAYVRGDPTLGVGWTLSLGYVETLYYNTGIAYQWTYMSADGGRHPLSLGLGTNPRTITTDGTRLRVTALGTAADPTSYTVEFPDGSIQTFNHTYAPPDPSPASSSLDFTNQGLPVSETRFGLSTIQDSFRQENVLTVNYGGSPSEIANVVLSPAGSPRTLVFHWKSYTVSGGVNPPTWRVLDYIDFPATASQVLRTTFAFQNAIFARNNYDLSAGSSCFGTG